jgi:hypothetical protein
VISSDFRRRKGESRPGGYRGQLDRTGALGATGPEISQPAPVTSRDGIGKDKASQTQMVALFHGRHDRPHAHPGPRWTVRAEIQHSLARQLDSPIPEIRITSLQMG